MAQVKAVPEGYHTITPMFCVKGAAEAIELYKKAFGAEERMRMPGPNGIVMHAEIKIGDSILMMTDSVQDPATSSAIFLYVNDVDAFFKRAVAAGCKAVQPPTDMPWGDRFARMTDNWNNRWAVATHIEDVPEAEMKKRMEKMQAEMAAQAKK